MLSATLALLLLAAAAHAGWNLVFLGSPNRGATLCAATLLGGLIFSPAWLLGPAPGVNWQLVALSAGAELVYFAGLSGAYARLDFAVAYATARGSATVFAATGAVIVLGEHLSAVGGAGMAAVVAGLVLVSRVPAGSIKLPPAGLSLALLAGASIATYTITDKVLVGALGPARVAGLVLPLTGVTGCLLLTLAGRGGEIRALAQPPQLGRLVVISVGIATAYGLVLLALRLSPAVYVAPVREISVLFGAVAARLWLREAFPRRRIGGAALIAGGVLLLTIGL